MTHTSFTVLDDTQRHPDLAERIDQILRRVAPTVSEITGLPLPAKVRFRLLTPKAWREETRQHRMRILARDIADLDLLPAEISAMRLALKLGSFVPVLLWPLVPATTQEAADSQWETTTIPQTLRHCGVLTEEPFLVQVVAHELVHHMQEEAAGGTVWTSFFLPKRGVLASPKSVSAIVEGHATWAERQTLKRLFGTAADFREGPKSWRYRLHNRGIVRRFGPSREAYEQGSRLIAQAVAALGTGLVNQVWKDATHLPTESEIADPPSWIRRIERGLPGV
ncbi:zinc-dependent metalloprotease [Streptomyces prunicolor]|uniref:zinc-dependent metalloprotease n=1 Tax=Streptomyces prunicolor TaxID=67348 RepID=UPI000360A6EF|nr:zinc-dependent metalloprotease [Streptomyces prunicolor]